MILETLKYKTLEEQMAANEYVASNNIDESQIWIDGELLRIVEAEVEPEAEVGV